VTPLGCYKGVENPAACPAEAGDRLGVRQIEQVALSWWLWVIIGVGSAVCGLVVVAVLTALAIGARADELGESELFEQYFAPKSGTTSPRPARRPSRSETPTTRTVPH